MPAETHKTAPPHTLHLLIPLRWLAVVGQLVTVFAAGKILDVDLRMEPLLLIVAVTAFTNILLWIASWKLRRLITPRIDVITAGIAMILDLILLTLLLFYSGGPHNPFSVFFFVNLTLAAALMPAAWAWANCALGIGFYTLLFWGYRGMNIEGTPTITPDADLSLLELGMMVAFFTCSVTVVLFTTLIRIRLSQREGQLRRYQEEVARAQKLEALGTLAAGAAHELATPLSTIAVIVRELERRFPKENGKSGDAEVASDLELMRSELSECRAILDRMSADAGQALGEQIANVSPAELADEVLSGVRERDRVRVELPAKMQDRRFRVPALRLSQAIRGIVQNALFASPANRMVLLRFSLPKKGPAIEIRDEGEGIPPEILQRVGEPFFTTREPGVGTGLGIYLARTVAESLGGNLAIQSQINRGTTVSFTLPWELLEEATNK